MSDDGCAGYNSLYLDNHGDWDDVVAWAYMPTGCYVPTGEERETEAANAS